MRRLLLILGLAAAFTIAASPAIGRRLDRYAQDATPKPDYEGPKYAIGGRYVTKAEFNERIHA